MVLSSYAEGDYHNGWHCSNYKKCHMQVYNNGIERWFCEKCQEDYCFHCEPKLKSRPKVAKELAIDESKEKEKEKEEKEPEKETEAEKVSSSETEWESLSESSEEEPANTGQAAIHLDNGQWLVSLSRSVCVRVCWKMDK